MSIKIFNCSPTFFPSECCHDSCYDICNLFIAQSITPDALYRCYASRTRNVDNVYRKLLIPFPIKLEIFVTINTRARTRAHAHTHTRARTHARTPERSVASSIRPYATSLKVSWSRPCEMNKYSIYVILHSVQGPGVYSTCNWNEYQKEESNVSWE
jgi:hypothetical protein